MIIVCFGDSITRASSGPERHRWPTILQFLLEDARAGGFGVYNRGVDGDTSSQGLDRMNGDVIRLLPATVLVEFGFNDANCRDWRRQPRVPAGQYASNLREVGELVRKGRGRPVFIINHHTARKMGKQGDRRSYYKRMLEYNEIIREVAADMKADAIDMPARLKARGVAAGSILSDGVHLTPEGNRIYAEIVLAALREILGIGE